MLRRIFNALTFKQKLRVYLLVLFLIMFVFPIPLVLAIIGLVVKNSDGDKIIPIWLDILFWILPFISLTLFFMILKNIYIDRNKQKIEEMMKTFQQENFKDIFANFSENKNHDTLTEEGEEKVYQDKNDLEEIDKTKAIEVETLNDDDSAT